MVYPNFKGVSFLSISFSSFSSAADSVARAALAGVGAALGWPPAAVQYVMQGSQTAKQQ